MESRHFQKKRKGKKKKLEESWRGPFTHTPIRDRNNDTWRRASHETRFDHEHSGDTADKDLSPHVTSESVQPAPVSSESVARSTRTYGQHRTRRLVGWLAGGRRLADGCASGFVLYSVFVVLVSFYLLFTYWIWWVRVWLVCEYVLGLEEFFLLFFLRCIFVIHVGWGLDRPDARSPL